MGLVQDAVLELHGKPTVAAAEHGKQVVLEDLNYTPGLVALMDVGGSELVVKVAGRDVCL